MNHQPTHTAAIILAAGRGTRMQAKDKNKVAFQLNGSPMIKHTVDNLHAAGIEEIIAVVGFQADSVREALGDSVIYAEQKEQLGTGHALKTALPTLSPDIQTVLLVSGDDSAFYPPTLYQEIVATKKEAQADVIVLTIHKEDPTGLGRIVRDADGNITRIVEEKNATIEEKTIQEINTGFYCFDREFLDDYADKIKKNPVSNEYYATDLVEIALSAGKTVSAHFVEDASVWHGVNTREDYKQAKLKYQQQEHV